MTDEADPRVHVSFSKEAQEQTEQLINQESQIVDQLKRPLTVTDYRGMPTTEYYNDLLLGKHRNIPNLVIYRSHLFFRVRFITQKWAMGEVPPFGERLLSLLVSPKRLEEAMGDFEQAFRVLAERHGTSHARLWYYWQVALLALRSILTNAVKVTKIWAGL